jgi:hypothetical protein
MRSWSADPEPWRARVVAAAEFLGAAAPAGPA